MTQTYEGWSRPDPGMRRDIVGVRDLSDGEYERAFNAGIEAAHAACGELFSAEEEDWSGWDKGYRFGLAQSRSAIRSLIKPPPSSDGRKEYLMHNEALCRPYYIAVDAPKEEK